MAGLRILFFAFVACVSLVATATASECDDWEWTELSNSVLKGYNDLLLTDKDSADECKRICKNQETNFTCRSVEYSKTEASCHLSAATKSTIGIEIVTVEGVTYYELYCDDEPSTMSKAAQYFKDHPSYVVIYGMGGMCLLLVVIAVVIILTAPSRGR
ncbi:hypothetical protein NP493_705g03035 [Ridgeia piscesae]|uniref:Apple domain-containing protein n=1 Tax=Ridgeia piscesae TaxID=27915 RepID=A0AAD9KQH7_RIDPI|nr:hypothetical protein NP493_705g03035 [Ridgeia piscesae]